jgi:putative Mn2+ efflux pump MntP
MDTLLTSISLALDCFSVSISNSACPNYVRKDALTYATSFGFFQSFMLLSGYSFGLLLESYIRAFDHWIAFLLLLFAGVNMIRGNEVKSAMLLILSIATSIDALSVGIALSLLGLEIITPSLVAGGSSFLLTIAGYCLGSRLRGMGDKSEKVGGLILIAIGVKILMEHTLG